MALAEAAEPEIRGPNQAAWLDRLETEHDNLRAALAWCHDDSNGAALCLRLAVALWRFWMVRGYFSEGRAHLEKALSREQVEDLRSERARALRGAGILASYQNDFAQARDYCLQSLAIYEASLPGDVQSQADVLYTLGAILISLDDFREARACFKRSLANYNSVGDRREVANTINNWANIALREGKYRAAASLYKRSRGIRIEIDDERGVALSLFNLATVACRQGAYERADPPLRQSLEFYHKIGDRRAMANALALFASIAANQGQAQRAARLWGAAEALHEAIGSLLSPHERAVYDPEVVVLRAALGAAFPSAWKEGRTMGIEQVVEYALEARERSVVGE